MKLVRKRQLNRYLKMVLVFAMLVQTPVGFTKSETSGSLRTSIANKFQSSKNSTKAMAQSLFEKIKPSGWVPKDPTLLERIGVDPLEHLGSQRSLTKAISAETNRSGIPETFNADYKGPSPATMKKAVQQLGLSSESLEKLGTEASELSDPKYRKEVIKDLRSALKNIAFVTGKGDIGEPRLHNEENLRVSDVRKNDPEFREKMVKAKTVSKSSLDRLTNQLSEVKRIEVLMEELKFYKEHFGDKYPEILKQAAAARGQVVSLFKSALVRELYTRVHNLAFLKGEKSQTPFEKNNTKIANEVPKPTGENVNWTDLKKDLTLNNIGVQYKQITIIITTILFLVATYQMIWAYEKNPNMSEDTLRMLMNPAFQLAAGTFFVGGKAAHYGSLEVMRRTYSTLGILLKNKAAWTGRYDAYRAKISGQMAVMSSAFLVGGMLIFPIAYKSLDKLFSCTMDLAGLDLGREIKEKRMSTARRGQLEQLCQTGITEIIAETVFNPHTWMHIVSLVGAKRLIDIAKGTTESRLSRFLVPVGNAAKSTGKHVARFIPQGLKAPLMTVTGFVGGVETIVWIALAEAIYWFGMKPAYSYANINRPLKRYKSRLVDLVEEWKENKWDATNMCKSHWFFDGWFKGTFSQIYSMFSSRSDMKLCGEPMMVSFLDAHANYEKTWRDGIVASSSQAIQNWVRHNSQAVNMYQATKLFYKDIFEQVKLQRQLHPKFKVPTKNILVEDVTETVVDPAASVVYSNVSLPLFRSSPFFGWKQPEDNAPVLLPYDENIDWNAWVAEPQIVSSLDERWTNFTEKQIPEIVKTIEKVKKVAKEDVRKKALSNVLLKLNSKETLHVAQGMELISYYSEAERKQRYCRKSLHREMHEKRKAYCPFNYVQSKHLDPQIFRWNGKDEVYSFKNHIANQSMGYNSNNNVTPFGGKPLSPGQEYLINYEHKFIRAGVDPHFYEGHQFGLTAETMTEYLLKNMICGKQAAVYHQNLQRYDFGIFKPEFNPPGLPLKKDLDVCANWLARNTPLVGKVVTIGKRGWNTQADFYHSIVDKRGPEYGKYAGIVDLLFRELDVDSIGDFDHWWDTEVRPQFALVLDEKEKIFQDDIVNGEMAKALYKTTGNLWALKSGYLDAVTEQIDLYFNTLLDPMVKELPIDTQFMHEKQNKSEARGILQNSYSKFKKEFYEIFNVLKGKLNGFQSEKLRQEYADLLENMVLDAEQLPMNQHLQKKSMLEVVVLQSMLTDRMYDLEILFRSNNSESFTDVIDGVREIVREHPDLNGLEKEALNFQLTGLQIKAMDDFSTDLYRVNRVVLDHPNIDKEGGVDRPRARLIHQVFLNIEILLGEMTDLIKTRESFNTIDKIDGRQ